MAVIQHSIDIDAAPGRVWSVIGDLPEYPTWNPFLVDGQGEFTVNRRLRLQMRVGTRTMTFRPTVLDVREGRRVRWLGRLGIPGIFDGEHVLDVEPLDSGRSRFTQREEFRGILVPFMRSLLRSTEAGFQAMNEALKARAEATP
jgi:hypothetical protein